MLLTFIVHSTFIKTKCFIHLFLNNFNLFNYYVVQVFLLLFIIYLFTLLIIKLDFTINLYHLILVLLTFQVHSIPLTAISKALFVDLVMQIAASN